MNKLWDISFFLPKVQSYSQSAWCTEHLQEIYWSSGHEKYTALETLLNNLKAPAMDFFANSYEKFKILSEISETKLQTWMSTHSRKIRI